MSDKQLIEIISNNLPISEEDAELFVNGLQMGYLSPSLKAIMAIAYRDKVIDQLEKDNKYLRAKLKYELDRKIKEWENAKEIR